MSIILAADTSTGINTVALCRLVENAPRPMEVLAEISVQCGRRHAERLLPITDFVLHEAGLSFNDVTLLAVSSGPGSFTGLRLGIATWKGLALARDLPLVAVPTLDALSLLADIHTGRVCTLLDARMDEVYGAIYEFREGIRACPFPVYVGPVEDLSSEWTPDTLFLGDGAVRYADRIRARQPGAICLGSHHGGPRAAAVAAEALAMLAKGCNTNADLVEPVYLRKSQAEVNRDEAEQAAVT